MTIDPVRLPIDHLDLAAEVSRWTGVGTAGVIR